MDTLIEFFRFLAHRKKYWLWPLVALLVVLRPLPGSRAGFRPRTLHLQLIPSMYILGISAFFHDSAACLLRDGNIAAAAQEERFSRKKK